MVCILRAAPGVAQTERGAAKRRAAMPSGPLGGELLSLLDGVNRRDSPYPTHAHRILGLALLDGVNRRDGLPELLRALVRRPKRSLSLLGGHESSETNWHENLWSS